MQFQPICQLELMVSAFFFFLQVDFEGISGVSGKNGVIESGHGMLLFGAGWGSG